MYKIFFDYGNEAGKTSITRGEETKNGSLRTANRRSEDVKVAE